MSTVSIVKSRFHTLMLGNFERSTYTLLSVHRTFHGSDDVLSSYSYLAGPLVYARQINFADERHLWWYVGVIWSAVDLEGVYAILMDALDSPKSFSLAHLSALR